MKKTDAILDEIHAIRRQIDEETKNMTDEERAAHINQSTKAALKESGYKIVYIDDKKTRFRIERDPHNIQSMKNSE